VTLEELAEQTGVELPDGDYETAAGYLMARLGRMPVEGDAVSVGEHVLTVTAIEGRRITQVELSPTPVSPDQSPSDAEWQTASTLLPSGSRTKAP
jgi:putative hemolysin